MKNLRKLRTEKNLSQQKLAEQFGITQQAIFSYENEISEPDIYMLKQMASFFNTSIDYLVGYTDCPYTPDSIKVINEISPQQLRLLEHYLQLPKDMQEHLDAIIDNLASTF